MAQQSRSGWLSVWSLVKTTPPSIVVFHISRFGFSSELLDALVLFSQYTVEHDNIEDSENPDDQQLQVSRNGPAVDPSSV